MSRATLAFIILAALAACGSGENLSGTYVNDAGLIEMRYTFEGDKVYMGVMGAETAMLYKIEGKRVLIGPEGAQQVLTINEDGSLSGPGGRYTRKDE